MAKAKAPVAAALPPIPPPPPEFWQYLMEVLQALFSGVCPASTNKQALDNIRNPSARGYLRAMREMDDRFAKSDSAAEWKKHGRRWMRKAMDDAQDMTPDDVKPLLTTS